MIVAAETINRVPYVSCVGGQIVKYEPVREKYLELCSPVKFNRRQIQCLKDPEYDNFFRKAFDYIKDHPSVLYKIFSCSGQKFTEEDACVLPGSFILGAIIPTIIQIAQSGAIFDPVTEVLKYPIGVIPVAPDVTPILIGAAIGVGLILTANVTQNIYRLTKEQATIEWNLRRNEMIKYTSKWSVLKHDDVLKHFVCPITKDLPICPMRAPNYVTYDGDSLEDMLDHGIIPPKSHKLFDKTDLTFDYSHANTITMRIREIVNAIKFDSSLMRFPHMPDFVDAYTEKRQKVVSKVINQTAEVASLVSSSSDFTDKIISKHNDDEKQRDLILDAQKEYFKEMASDLKSVSRKAVKVAVCTNNWFEKIGISLFGWAGVKPTMEFVEVLPDLFPNVSNARSKRLGISSEPIEYEKR